MRRIVVELYGVPFNPTYETDDGIKIGDKVRVPGGLFIHRIFDFSAPKV